MQAEFNTNVPDKDDRKKARRQRIEKRYEEKNRELGDSGEGEQGTNRTGGQQVSDSLLHLDRHGNFHRHKMITLLRMRHMQDSPRTFRTNTHINMIIGRFQSRTRRSQSASIVITRNDSKFIR